MADYKEIVGTKVKAISANPSDPTNGQVWYNSTDEVLRYKKANVAGAWSAGGNLNTGRYEGECIGIQTAALWFGGVLAPGPGAQVITESYNGSAWTEVNDLNAARDYLAGAGTTSAGLAFGGEPTTAANESWNGTSWTETTDMNLAKDYHCGSGTQTAALAFGGEDPGGLTAKNESWNGSGWTEVGDLNTARKSAGAATQLASTSLIFGGDTVGNGTPTQACESWNGSAWTEVNDLNTTSRNLSGCGISTAAMAMGRYNPTASNYELVEHFNGTSWTEVADMSTSRHSTSGCGTQALGLCAGGNSNSVATEEFSAVYTVTVE